jgi:uncharacterized membrane protein
MLAAAPAHFLSDADQICIPMFRALIGNLMRTSTTAKQLVSPIFRRLRPRHDLIPSDARTKLIVAALIIGAFAIGLDTFVIIGALDVIARDLAIATGTAGWIISIYALCYAVFAPLNAWMFKGMSRRNVQILSVSIFIIGNLICAIAPNFLTVVAGRVIRLMGRRCSHRRLPRWPPSSCRPHAKGSRCPSSSVA